MWNYMANIILGLFWLSIIATIILILGALVIYRLNRRIGGASILLTSIITLLPGFFFLILGPSLFLGSILGLIAGGLSTHGDEEPPTTVE